MIDREKTLRELSVDCSKLKPQSVKKVYWRCSRCGAEKLKPYRDCLSGTGLCSTCYRADRGRELGSVFGRRQPKQGACIYCGSPVGSRAKTCLTHRRAHLSKVKSGSSNPAWRGASLCVCGERKSYRAKLCRACSFASGSRSGKNNGRWIEDRGVVVSARVARTILSNTMRLLGKKKHSSTANMIGYTFEDLKRHLESQFEPWMTWDNYGIGQDQWCVDHIVPVSALVRAGVRDPAVINGLWNLRPMRATDNFRKSDAVDEAARALAREKLGISL